jgi:hypothetical protein
MFFPVLLAFAACRAAGGPSPSTSAAPDLPGARQGPPPGPVFTVERLNRLPPAAAPHVAGNPVRVDLAPAKWIWLPSQRTLPNTFVLFRRELVLDAAPVRAAGWMTADSRYRLTVNGKRIQWGPAPCDPRWLDADPVDLAPHLRPGANVIGVEVLHYGHAEGTWPGGKPGLLFHVEIEHSGGRVERVVSDASWPCLPDRAHPPGQYKRSFQRALQETFDARLHPHGWDAPGFAPDGRWTAAQVIGDRADLPPSCTGYPDYLHHMGVDAGVASLRARQTPLLRNDVVAAPRRLAASGRVRWGRDPEDAFDFRMPGAFEIDRVPAATDASADGCGLPATPDPREGVFATFEFERQEVGWPYFTIDAPAGTIVDLLVQEGHDPSRTAWLDTHIHAWSRFVCREGENRFEAFDFESFRWLQLHVRNASRPVTVLGVGARVRRYPWPQTPRVRCAEPDLQRLFDACLHTLDNSAQETIVDGMGRERQQYSGDCGHQLHAIRYAFGDTLLAKRYLRTWSEGLTKDGYFLDCWPASDRLERLAQRQYDGTFWGPLLDHGVAFGFDCWNHYWETGDLDALREPWPRLVRFARYLEDLRRADGLLPAEDLGVPSLWIDHRAYGPQRDKRCVFNLYAAGMFRRALAPLAQAFGDEARARHYDTFGRGLEEAAARAFWDPERGLFVDNRPWAAEDGKARLSDRTLATALLFDQCPGGRTDMAVRALAEPPAGMGMSYPANAGWRLRALARHGRADVAVREFRTRWAGLPSVLLNGTIQEEWDARPDSPGQWSHAAVVPLYVLFMDIAGIRPAAPGFARCEIRPQLGDLGEVELVARTPRGPILFKAVPEGEGHRVTVELPAGCEGELLLPEGAKTALPAAGSAGADGLRRHRLPPGEPGTAWTPPGP